MTIAWIVSPQPFQAKVIYHSALDGIGTPDAGPTTGLTHWSPIGVGEGTTMKMIYMDCLNGDLANRDSHSYDPCLGKTYVHRYVLPRVVEVDRIQLSVRVTYQSAPGDKWMDIFFSMAGQVGKNIGRLMIPADNQEHLFELAVPRLTGNEIQLWGGSQDIIIKHSSLAIRTTEYAPCQPGDVATETCWDGSGITTKVCNNYNWQDTGNVCPEQVVDEVKTGWYPGLLIGKLLARMGLGGNGDA